MNVRTVFGVLSWLFSGSLRANATNRLIGVSSDKNSTKYFLSKVQRSNQSAGNNILYATTPFTRPGVEAPKIYIFPNPVYNNFYVSGVDEDDTHLIIYDMDGNCIAGEFGNEIEVDFLAKGTYILGINEYFVKFLKL